MVPPPSSQGSVDSLFEQWLAEGAPTAKDFEAFAALHAAEADALRRLFRSWSALNAAMPGPPGDEPRDASGARDDARAGGDPTVVQQTVVQQEDAARAAAGVPVVLREGAVLGDYRLLRRLGSGAMGQVWEAEQVSLGRRVALKMLRPGPGASGGARLLREARAAGGINHPGIVPVFAAGDARGQPFVAQQLVGDGRTLADLVETRRATGEPGPIRIAGLFAEIAGALQAAHEAGILHRDLKPRNILIDADGRPRVGDFGLALRLGSEQAMGFAGTCAYMSPEQARGSAALDARSDVFSLGAVLYEALALRRPFDGATTTDVLEAVQHERPTSPHRVQRDVPVDLSAVCLKALEKDPGARYADMAALRDDLRRFLAHQPVLARRPGAAGRALKWSRRHPGRATALLLGGISLLVVALLLARESQLRGRAEERAVEARWQGYLANLRAAGTYLQRGNPVEARQRLAACPAELRGWEWRHAARLVDAEVQILPGHAGGATAVALAEDGEVVSGDAGSTLRRWTPAGAPLESLGLGAGSIRALHASRADGGLVAGTSGGAVVVRAGRGAPLVRAGDLGAPVRAVSLSDDGRLVAACTGDGRLLLRDLGTGADLTPPLDLPEDLASAALSVQGCLLVTGSRYGVVTLRPLDPARDPVLLHGFDRGPAVVGVAASGARVAAGLPDGSLRWWSAPDWDDDATLPIHARAAAVVALSRDGRWIASATAADEPVTIVDAVRGRAETRLTGHAGLITSLAISADAAELAAGCSDGSVYVWRRDAAGPLVELAPPGRRARSLAASAGGDVIAWCDGLGTQVSLLVDGEPSRVELGPGSVVCVGLDATGTLLAAGRVDGTVQLWDLAHGRRGRAVRVGERPVEALAIVAGGGAPDGRRVLAAVDRELVLIDVQGAVLRRLAGHEGTITALAASADGRRAVTASVDGSVRAWDVPAGTSLLVRRGEPYEDHAVAIDPSGRLLAAAQVAGGSVALHDAATGERLAELTDLESGVPSLAFGDGGRLLFTASYHGRHLRVWDTASGENLFDFRDEHAGTAALAWADGRVLIATADGRLMSRDGEAR